MGGGGGGGGGDCMHNIIIMVHVAIQWKTCMQSTACGSSNYILYMQGCVHGWLWLQVEQDIHKKIVVSSRFIPSCNLYNHKLFLCFT